MESALINYGEQTTEELLALLVSYEDKVAESLLREVAARPDAHKTLREWLRDSERWHDKGCGHWWSLYHAFMALSLNGDPAHIDDLLTALKAAFIHDFDWIEYDSIAALAQFGPAGVDRLIAFINAERSHSLTDENVCDYRNYVMMTLTRIALDYPAEHARIADFIVGRYTDPEEADPEFLALNIDNAMLLDLERCRQVFPDAYERGAVDAELGGDNGAEAIAFFEATGHGDQDMLTGVFLEFYQPEAIAERDGRWTKVPEADWDDDDWDDVNDGRDDNALLALNRANYADSSIYKTLHAPAGYTEASSGSLVRETKVGRNDPCPCGSGKKYKKCCGKEA